ncbi:universal stress protein [Aquibium sp. LZ166]|uniref:Universal stress protein n=1 Tax=Aquibium pacificus TaxID=3153579 RepID=A0ABV3SQH9_9HYPH
MIYRTVMVQLDLDGAPEPRIRFALDVAGRFEADLIGFCAAQPHTSVAPMDGAIVSAELMQRESEEIEARLKEIGQAFESIAGHGESVSFRGSVGDPTRLFAENARAADLLVTGIPKEGTHDTFRSPDLGTLILSAGRPVLVASGSQEPLKSERVLVAWKDTREARRAVIDAMPFLAHAKDVLVATVDEDDRIRSKESLADVVRFLMKHGVAARSECLLPADEEFGDTLSTTAFEMGADLIVSGGYGHSRLREWAFGGVTRRLLHASSVNRLLSN